MDKKDTNEWLKLLSDEARADVMKTQIIETEMTRRKEIEEHEHTRRDAVASEDVRMATVWVWCIIVIAVTMSATCVGYHKIDAWQSVNQSHLISAPSASSSAHNQELMMKPFTLKLTDNSIANHLSTLLLKACSNRLEMMLMKNY